MPHTGTRATEKSRRTSADASEDEVTVAAVGAAPSGVVPETMTARLMIGVHAISNKAAQQWR